MFLKSGKLPLETGDLSVAAMLKRVCEEIPLPPSATADKSLAAAGLATDDLDAIVLKALAKSPDERYPTVDALIVDIDNARAHRPIIARRTNRGYVLRRFVRRHRLWIAVAAAFLIAVIAGAAGVLWQARLVAEQRDIARDNANQNGAINDFLVALLGNAAPNDEPIRVSDLLAKARERGFDSETAPVQRNAMASVLARIYNDRSDVQGTVEMLVPFMNKYGDGLPSRTYADLASQLGDALRTLNRLPEAKRWLEAGLARAATLGASGDVLTSMCLSRLANIAFDTEADPEISFSLHRRSLSVLESDQSVEGVRQLADSEQYFALDLLHAGRRRERREHIQHSLDLLKSLHEENSALSQNALDDLAADYDWSGYPLRADQIWEESLLRQEKTIGASPWTAGRLMSAVAPKIRLNDYSSALALLDRSEAMFKSFDQSGAAYTSYYISILRWRGIIHAMLAQREQSQTEFARARTLSNRSEAMAHTWASNLQAAEAIALLVPSANTSDIRKALALLEEARENMKASGNQAGLASSLVLSAEAALLAGELESATDFANDARASYTKQDVDTESAYLARCDVVLAQVKLHNGDRTGAHFLFESAAKHMEISLGPQHPRTLATRKLVDSTI